MKQIKIENKNVKKIEEALWLVQKYSRERTITVEDIMAHAECAIAYVNDFIPKFKSRRGIEIAIDVNAQHFPNAYYRKGSPQSTVFYLVCKTTGWYITDIVRSWCAKKTFRLCALPKAAQDCLIENFENFNIG